jgi:hypothetical protein
VGQHRDAKNSNGDDRWVPKAFYVSDLESDVAKAFDEALAGGHWHGYFGAAGAGRNRVRVGR